MNGNRYKEFSRLFFSRCPLEYLCTLRSCRCSRENSGKAARPLRSSPLPTSATSRSPTPPTAAASALRENGRYSA